MVAVLKYTPHHDSVRESGVTAPIIRASQLHAPDTLPIRKAPLVKKEFCNSSSNRDGYSGPANLISAADKVCTIVQCIQFNAVNVK
jgi:hypothetical protein